MRRQLLFTLFCLLLGGLRGQTQPAPALRLQYMGYTLAHPGLNVAWVQPLKTLVKEKGGKKPGECWHTLYAAPQIGYYGVVKNYRALFANGELGYKRTSKRGFEGQVFVLGGYQYSFLANPVWVQQADGSFQQKKGAGRGSLMYRGGFGIGDNLYKRGKAPLSWAIRLGLTQSGQATSALSPVWELGINYYLTSHS